MADLVCNIAKGRIAELVNRVKNNDPTNAALVWVALNITGDQDDVVRDADTLTAVLGDANIAEVANTGYARQVWVDTDLSALSPDDTNNRMDIDGPDLAFGAITDDDVDWTDLLLCYDSDTTGGTDSNVIPLALYDFAVTIDGSSITAQLNAAGFFRAS